MQQDLKATLQENLKFILEVERRRRQSQVQEPVMEEPVIHQRLYHGFVIHEVEIEEPVSSVVGQSVVIEEPLVQEPVVENPSEPLVQEPVVQESAENPSEPLVQEPVVEAEPYSFPLSDIDWVYVRGTRHARYKTLFACCEAVQARLFTPRNSKERLAQWREYQQSWRNDQCPGASSSGRGP